MVRVRIRITIRVIGYGLWLELGFVSCFYRLRNGSSLNHGRHFRPALRIMVRIRVRLRMSCLVLSRLDLSRNVWSFIY
jgi:hypothetical protein